MTRKTLINGLNEMESKEEHAREHVYTRSLIVMPTRGVVFITSTKPEVRIKISASKFLSVQ